MANLLALPSNTSCNATAVPNRKDAKTPAICAGLTQQGTSIIDRALAEASSFCRRLSAIATCSQIVTAMLASRGCQRFSIAVLSRGSFPKQWLIAHSSTSGAEKIDGRARSWVVSKMTTPQQIS